MDEELLSEIERMIDNGEIEYYVPYDEELSPEEYENLVMSIYDEIVGE